MNDKCVNCGADEGLHHYQTMQCPVGGREAPIGRKQEWKTTTFEKPDESQEIIEKLLNEKAAQAAEIARLREALENDARYQALEAAAREVVEIVRDAMLVQRLTKTKAGSEAWRKLAALLGAK